ncbi:MAG TPA: glycosyltransferase family 29 protein [Dongiaceae bacterium]|nr:glycosyltransferase family 29 protein [Dongiaceae bacterium]
MQRLLDHLADRSVAIVGNATSLLAHAWGDIIDEHDVVVRMNRGIPVDPRAQGRKFDVCCFSTLRDHGAVLRQAAPTFAVWMSPKFREEYDGSIDVCFYPLQFWQALHDKLNARPSVGAMTVDLVSRSAARAVTVIGFDFKRSGTFYAAGQHIGPHDYAAESRYVLDACAAKGWRFVELGVSQSA